VKAEDGGDDTHPAAGAEGLVPLEMAEDTAPSYTVSSSNITAANEQSAALDPPVSIKTEGQVQVKVEDDGGDDTHPAADAEDLVPHEMAEDTGPPATVSSSNITASNEQSAALEPPASIKTEGQVQVKVEDADKEDTKPAAFNSANLRPDRKPSSSSTIVDNPSSFDRKRAPEDMDGMDDQKPAAVVSPEASDNVAVASGKSTSEQGQSTVSSSASATTTSISEQASSAAAAVPKSKPPKKKKKTDKEELQSGMQRVGNLNLPETARNSGLEGIHQHIHDDRLPAKFTDVLKLMDFFFEGGSYFQVLWLDASRAHRLGFHTRFKLRKLNDNNHPGVAWHQHKKEWAPRCKQDLLSFIPVLQTLYED